MRLISHKTVIQALLLHCTGQFLQAQPLQPNDPRIRDQWHLSHIGAPTVWSATTGTTNVVVVVIDTGVDYTHPDLAANMWRNPGESGLDAQGRDKATNGIDDDGNGYVDDVHGVDVHNHTGDPMDGGFWAPPDIPESAPVYHGTSIAGIIGAVGNNGLGVSGVNWTASIMAIRLSPGDATDLQGESEGPFYRDIVAAYDYVLQMKRRGVNIRVISNSYYTLTPGRELEERMRDLEREDILSVYAGGDFRNDTDLYSNYPGTFNFGNLLMVATSDRQGALRPLSPYGRSTIDLAAPGFEITSTTKGGGYVSGLSGTSYACPVVAGAALLLLAREPNLTTDQLKAALLGSVDYHPSLRGKVLSNGRLNIARAFEYLANPKPPPIVITALPAGQRTRTNAPIQIVFNRPMNRTAVEEAWLVQPGRDGTIEWSDDNRRLTFRPLEPWDPKTNYTVRIRGTARDFEGQALDGNFDRTDNGSPADDFVWGFGFPVPNDDSAEAQPIAGPSGRITGTNRYASWEVGEPQPVERGAQIRANTVWYLWSPPQGTNWVTFTASPKTSFDLILEVWSGTEIGHLSPVASPDKTDTTLRNRHSFQADGATKYMIRISGKDAYDPTAAGDFTLQWNPTPPPNFAGTQFSPAMGIPGTAVTLTGTNFIGATAILVGGANATFTHGLGKTLDLRLTFVVPPDAISGPITVVTPYGTATSATSFQVLPPPLSARGTSGGQVEVAWSAIGNNFILEWAPDLSTSAWQTVAAQPLISNGRSRVIDSGTEGVRFYRLRAER